MRAGEVMAQPDTMLKDALHFGCTFTSPSTSTSRHIFGSIFTHRYLNIVWSLACCFCGGYCQVCVTCCMIYGACY